MKKVEIIIPWRDSGCEYRKRSLNFLYNLYEKHFGSVLLSDSDTHEFNRSRARNLGALSSSSEIIVISDADLFVPIPQLEAAIDKAQTYRNQIRPFSEFGHMNRRSTEFFMSQPVPEEISESKFRSMSTVWPGLHGGTFVMNRELWLSVGGMDENFTGWGGEDNAFNIRCEQYLGCPVGVLDGYAFHFFHPYHRRMSRKNSLLLESYRQGMRS